MISSSKRLSFYAAMLLAAQLGTYAIVLGGITSPPVFGPLVAMFGLSAILLLVPKTRRVTGLLVAVAMMVAVISRLDLAGRGGMDAPSGGWVYRISATPWIAETFADSVAVCLGLYVASPRLWWRIMSVWAMVALVLAQLQAGALHGRLRRTTATMAARYMAPRLAWVLPDFQLTSLADHGQLSLYKCGKPGDGILFYDPLCPYCHTSIRAIVEWRQALRAGGQELICIGLNRDVELCRDFLAAHNLMDTRGGTIAVVSEVKRLGIVRTPHAVATSANWRVTWQSGGGSSSGMFKALRDVSLSLAEQLVIGSCRLPEGVRLEWSPQPSLGAITLMVRGVDGIDTVCWCATAAGDLHQVELLVVLAGDVIKKVVALTWSAGLTPTINHAVMLDGIAGKKLDEVRQFLSRKAESGEYDGHSVAALVSALRCARTAYESLRASSSAPK
jgi:hypothetical protein